MYTGMDGRQGVSILLPLNGKSAPSRARDEFASATLQDICHTFLGTSGSDVKSMPCLTTINPDMGKACFVAWIPGFFEKIAASDC